MSYTIDRWDKFCEEFQEGTTVFISRRQAEEYAKAWTQQFETKTRVLKDGKIVKTFKPYL